MPATRTRPAGRPRNPALDSAILAAAGQQLGELGYARMSLESVAAAAGTTVPSVRRRFGSKAALAEAVIRSLRAAELPAQAGPPRARALAILENFRRNLLREDAMAVLGTLLAEQRRHPELLEIFRTRLAGPRRGLLRQALMDGVTAGELPSSADPDVLTSMLIGSFYARYIGASDLPNDWPQRTLQAVWPDQSAVCAVPRGRTSRPDPVQHPAAVFSCPGCRGQSAAITGSLGLVEAQDPERELIERALGRPVAATGRAAWGFTNRTDMVTLADGQRAVVQRYRHREDASYRLRVMQGLSEPAIEAGIPLPQVREFSLDDDPPWAIYDVLPGVPVPEAGELRPGGPRFTHAARMMGELLASFRGLPAADLRLDDLWADPRRLAAAAARWAEQLPVSAGRVLDAVPGLFAGRPVVLTHGDFAPVNILTDGTTVTGLLDFEAVRLADPLFDPAWWAWSVSFSGPGVLETAWPPFLAGAGIDPAESRLGERVHALQVLRMMEQLANGNLAPGIAGIVTDRLHGALT